MLEAKLVEQRQVLLADMREGLGGAVTAELERCFLQGTPRVVLAAMRELACCHAEVSVARASRGMSKLCVRSSCTEIWLAC